MQKQVITLTTADNSKVLALTGPHQLEISDGNGGAWGGGTLTPYGYDEVTGRGAQLQLDGTAYSTTADDTIACSAAVSEWELSGSTGATITISATPIIQATRRG